MLTLTPKEKSLLKDLKGQEKLCIAKYEKHASDAADPQLRDLFNQLGAVEQKHLDMLMQIEKGEVPATGGAPAKAPTFREVYTKTSTSAEKKRDAFLCTDLLTTEKHASHLYDACVFEFTQTPLRQVLNEIQTDEQGHGKMIYDYMAKNNLY